MKIKDLIKKLENFDPESDVVMRQPDNCNNPYVVVCNTIRVYYDFHDKQVCVDGHDKQLVRIMYS